MNSVNASSDSCHGQRGIAFRDAPSGCSVQSRWRGWNVSAQGTLLATCTFFALQPFFKRSCMHGAGDPLVGTSSLFKCDEYTWYRQVAMKKHIDLQACRKRHVIKKSLHGWTSSTTRRATLFLQGYLSQNPLPNPSPKFKAKP